MLEISVTQGQGKVSVTIMHLKGDFDTVGCETFDDRAQAIVTAGAQHVLVDLSAVSFMSSAGMRSLHRLFYQLHPEGSEEHKRILEEGIRKGAYKAPYMKLLNPAPRVLELLKLTGVDMYMDILSGKVDKAVTAF